MSDSKVKAKGWMSFGLGFRRGGGLVNNIGGSGILLLLLLLLLCSAVSPVFAAARGERWVDIWGSMPQLTEPHNLPPAPYVSISFLFFFCFFAKVAKFGFPGMCVFSFIPLDCVTNTHFLCLIDRQTKNHHISPRRFFMKKKCE